MSQNIAGKGVSVRKRYVESISNQMFWNKRIENTALSRFQKLIENKYSLSFNSYWDFHKWSVENFEDFWEEVWIFFKVIASKPYEKVFAKTGDGFLDNEWFKGARFSYAENILRIRDDRVALICLDESGEEDTVTYAEMFQEVSLFASALRKHGVVKGDRIGCYMSNRKEAIFALLASTSIGAIFGGPLCYYGSRAGSKILQIMDPKILIAVDHFQELGQLYSPINNLVAISENLPNLEKIVILPTRHGCISKNICGIPKSILMEDFLRSGRDSGGQVPEMVFEQLPSTHPVIITFTSGTTGFPKGITHSASSFLPVFVDFAFHMNLEENDIVYNHCIPGWSVWNDPIPSLALGLKLFLFSGSPAYSEKGLNIWNIFSKYNISFAYFCQSYVDYLEDINIVPDPGTNLDHLKIITLGASPVKPRNYKYLHKKVKEDLFIGDAYGASEGTSNLTGFDLNLPAYISECQLPALGIDLQCFNKDGKPVIGERGEVVILTPSPSMLLYLWGDKDNVLMHETYFGKFKGVFCPNDEGWVNPNTKGFVVLGRSDDAMQQYGELMRATDIYFAIDEMKEIENSICVQQERWDIETRVLLFVKLKQGYSFTNELKEKIRLTIKENLAADYVPQVIISVPDIPYNLNNKKFERVVRKIVATNEIPDISNIRNPDCLRHFIDIPEVVNYNKLK